MTALAATFVTCAAGAAGAQTTYQWNGNGTGWSDPKNWDRISGDMVSEYPGFNTADTAIIPGSLSNYPLLELDVEIGRLQINSGGVVQTEEYELTVSGEDDLNIASGGTFIIAASGSLLGTSHGTLRITGPGEHPVGGSIVLQDPGALLLVETTCSFVENSIAGSVVGQSNAAQVLIADEVTLTSEINLVGAMFVDADTRKGAATAAFSNQGFVRANSGAVGANQLTMGPELVLSDLFTSNVSIWQARDNSNAILRFESPALSLQGNFRIDNCATIQVANGVDVETGPGDLLNWEGTIMTGTGTFTTPTVFVNGTVTMGGKCEN